MLCSSGQSDLANDHVPLMNPPGHWPIEEDIRPGPNRNCDVLDNDNSNNKNNKNKKSLLKDAQPCDTSSLSGSIKPVTAEEWLSPEFQPLHMRQIIQESVLVAAGAAAILLQIASPGVAAGICEHSNFTARVPDRLRATMTYLYCISFGTPEEKRAIADAVTRVHGRVKGTLISPSHDDDDDDDEDNDERNSVKSRQTYSALDPDLQLWVAATLYHTGLDIYQQVFGRIDNERLQDEIYREYAIVGVALQVPADKWPASRAAFREYWDSRIASAVERQRQQQQNTTRCRQHAQDVARDLLYLPKSPWYLRVLTPSLRCITAGLLPEELCAGFGLEGGRGCWYRAHIFALRMLYRPLPLCVRSAPVRFYLANMRKRLRDNCAVFRKA